LPKIRPYVDENDIIRLKKKYPQETIKLSLPQTVQWAIKKLLEDPKET